MSIGPRTLFQKIWDAHAIVELDDGSWLLHIDRHLVNEVTSPQAFEGLRTAGRGVRSPGLTVAVADHNVPTENRDLPIADRESRVQVETLERNVAEFGVPYVPLQSEAQGIVHVIGPELGLTLPGMTIVCGDSHTSTHGAFGALAFGIGTSEVEHVLATQTLRQKPARTLLVRVENDLPAGTTAKDLVLYIIGQLGTAGGTGHVIEYAGSVISALDMAGRMTVCNMSIEAGARAGLIASDDKTFAWLRGRAGAPSGAAFDEATRHWRTLCSDPDARFDKEYVVDAAQVGPMVTWGTSPGAVARIDGVVPVLADVVPEKHEQMRAMLAYMALEPGQKLRDLPIDVVFIGSCTNGRIEDLRSAAQVAKGRRVAANVRALVVPGSGRVKREAEEEGLADIFRAAGFEWRDAGCSMCLGMNPDRLRPANAALRHRIAILKGDRGGADEHI